MAAPHKPTYFFSSIIGHVFILLGLVLGLDLSTPLPVIENTNKNDIISAVVLGDSAKSKILPQKLASLPPQPVVKEMPIPKEEPLPQPVQQASKDVIALKAAEKQKTCGTKSIGSEKTAGIIC